MPDGSQITGPAATDSLAVHVARDNDERARVFAFRYRVLVDELDIPVVDADHDRRQVRDALDDRALHLYLTDEDGVQACSRLLPADMGGIPDRLRRIYALDRFAPFKPAAFSFSDRLYVAPAWRKSRMPAVLLGAQFKLARRRGIRFDFTHCRPARVGLFEKLGYRRYGENFQDPDFGLQTPMVLLTEDERRLVRLNSPFAPMAQAAGCDPATANWFGRAFPHADDNSAKKLRDDKRFWAHLTELLHQTPLVGLPMLRGLTYAQAMRLLRQSTVLTCAGGDRLMRAGDPGNELFVLLSGAADIIVGETARHRITSFGPGAVLGEIGVLGGMQRTADVVITEDAEVLVLNEDILQRLVTRAPAIAAKVLFNLTLILCERLHATTVGVGGVPVDAPAGASSPASAAAAPGGCAARAVDAPRPRPARPSSGPGPAGSSGT